mmetsp:Transcript_81297/g.225048  ORF Transcript_81297/g.225048 Transcript_81297/m.225048 type:complete len:307 (-) Transcript_81297:390-1310(-)
MAKAARGCCCCCCCCCCGGCCCRVRPEVSSRKTSQRVLPLLGFTTMTSPWFSSRRWSFSSGRAASTAPSSRLLHTRMGLRSLRFLTWKMVGPPEPPSSQTSICRCCRESALKASSMSNRCQKPGCWLRPRSNGGQGSCAAGGPWTMRRCAAAVPSRTAVPPTSSAKNGRPRNSAIRVPHALESPLGRGAETCFVSTPGWPATAAAARAGTAAAVPSGAARTAVDERRTCGWGAAACTGRASSMLKISASPSTDPVRSKRNSRKGVSTMLSPLATTRAREMVSPLWRGTCSPRWFKCLPLTTVPLTL